MFCILSKLLVVFWYFISCFNFVVFCILFPLLIILRLFDALLFFFAVFCAKFTVVLYFFLFSLEWPNLAYTKEQWKASRLSWIPNKICQKSHRGLHGRIQVQAGNSGTLNVYTVQFLRNCNWLAWGAIVVC